MINKKFFLENIIIGLWSFIGGIIISSISAAITNQAVNQSIWGLVSIIVVLGLFNLMHFSNRKQIKN